MPTLRWLTRDEDVRAAEKVPYRLLEEVPEFGYGDRDAGNMLIQGDNLEALKALLPYYAGQVKCIYIDPPYNTGSAFEHYDDNLEHSIWLQLMFARLEHLRDLLSDTGSLFIQIDDNEGDYLKILLDEVMGRDNFVSRITVKTRSPSAFSTVNPGVFKSAEYVLWYAKRRNLLDQNRVWVEREADRAYDRYIENIDEDPSEWVITDIKEHAGLDIERYSIKSQLAKLERFYVDQARKIVRTASISDSGAGAETISAKRLSLEEPGKIIVQEREGYDPIYVLDGEQILFYSKNIHEIGGRLVPAGMLTNIWTDLSWEGIAAEGKVKFPKGKKPERLIQRVLELATQPGDLVLDSFLGSGTTASVAQKMGRNYIGIEIGEHAQTHCFPRLKGAVDGEQSGISKAVRWKGGGGFRFYRLGPPVFTEEGSIQPDIRFPVLAAHIWFAETGSPWSRPGKLKPFLGSHDGQGYALLYNGILGDKSASGGNVLTRKTLAAIRSAQEDFIGPMTVYGERTALSETTLKAERIEFKQTPYDVKARK